MARDRCSSMEEAIGLVADGDLVAIHHGADGTAPMAAVRELVRQGRRGLRVLAPASGIAVGWLTAAGVLDRVVAAGSEPILAARLSATARGVPFTVVPDLADADREALGADVVGVPDPFGGPDVLACRGLSPDVALVHVRRADRAGNAHVAAAHGAAGWSALLDLVGSARTVVLTAEEVVDGDVLRRHPDRAVLPGSLVTAVAEVPYGAHPMAGAPAYGMDAVLQQAWADAAGDAAAATAFLRAHVLDPADQAAYLDAAGGPEMMARVGRAVRP